MTGGSHILGNSPWLVYLSPPAFWVVEDILNLVNAGEGNQQTELGGATVLLSHQWRGLRSNVQETLV